MVVIQSDLRSAVQMAGKFGYFRQNQFTASRCLSLAALLRPYARALPSWPTSLSWRVSVRAFSTAGTEAQVKIVTDKPSLCTADELHYVSVSNSDWKLALWRYNPPPQVRVFLCLCVCMCVWTSNLVLELCVRILVYVC